MADHIAAAAGMPDQADHLGTSLRQAQGGLTFMADWVDQLRKDREKLDAVIDAVLPFAGPKDAICDGGDDSRLSDRYTMESERQIHQRIKGSDHTDEPAQDGGQSPADASGTDSPPISGKHQDGDEFDDNIELF